MKGPQQQECEDAMQDELGYINTTIRFVSHLVINNYNYSKFLVLCINRNKHKIIIWKFVN